MTVQSDLKQIKARNKRVELDKAWETSFTRRLAIALLTYVIVVIYSFLIANAANIFLSSLVPVIGFLLSTLSLRQLRRLWEKHYH
ncbi:hypothetical protein IJJ27_01985 [bacterium]|nr:hypothetical protein [bacterium]MBQ6436314.1 hypothetical protein [bacterium]